MEASEAIQLIAEFADNQINLYEAVNSGRGYQGKAKEETRLVKRLLTGLLGRTPTQEEMTAMEKKLR